MINILPDDKESSSFIQIPVLAAARENTKLPETDREQFKTNAKNKTKKPPQKQQGNKMAKR